MKRLSVSLLALILAVIVSACGNSVGKEASHSNSSNTNNQKQIEEENEKLKAETEKLKKELAEKGKEAEEIESSNTSKANSKKTEIADIMKLIVPELIEGGQLNEKTYNYLVDHSELFPAVTAKTKKTAESEADASITTKHLFKNINPYLDKMVTISGYVIDIEEEEADYGTIADIHIMDEYGNSVVGIYLSSTGDILEDDYVTMTGVPTEIYSFDNISGGVTNAVFFTVSTIEKE
ncbi:hypothetical protein [Paenibacillus motobuensis]|uniref:Lipoprotein n=1 Tax=Paenibacillus motobuensis TaxID=295324 RepID=A0ABP3I0F3_9BACL